MTAIWFGLFESVVKGTNNGSGSQNIGQNLKKKKQESADCKELYLSQVGNFFIYEYTICMLCKRCHDHFCEVLLKLSLGYSGLPLQQMDLWNVVKMKMIKSAVCSQWGRASLGVESRLHLSLHPSLGYNLCG